MSIEKRIEEFLLVNTRGSILYHVADGVGEGEWCAHVASKLVDELGLNDIFASVEYLESVGQAISEKREVVYEALLRQEKPAQ